jgi:hypothetical protein
MGAAAKKLLVKPMRKIKGFFPSLKKLCRIKMQKQLIIKMKLKT